MRRGTLRRVIARRPPRTTREPECATVLTTASTLVRFAREPQEGARPAYTALGPS